MNKGLMAALLALVVALVGCSKQTDTTAGGVEVAPVMPGGGAEGDAAGFSLAVTETDELAPDFILKDTDGYDVGLADFSGKILILDFWATYCKPCMKKLKAYEPIIEKYSDKGVELLAVSLDSTPEVAVGWAEQADFPYRIVMFDEEFQAAYFPESTGLIAIPQVRIIDRDGNLRFKFSPESTVQDVELALSKLIDEMVGGDEQVSEKVLSEQQAGAETPQPQETPKQAEPEGTGSED